MEAQTPERRIADRKALARRGVQEGHCRTWATGTRGRGFRMSDALRLLVKVCPEAMGHCFRFLKNGGRHLDPKTRDLISVITKVHAQTERGFRQYLNRASRDGCTPAEVLDALLMAFPATSRSTA